MSVFLNFCDITRLSKGVFSVIFNIKYGEMIFAVHMHSFILIPMLNNYTLKITEPSKDWARQIHDLKKSNSVILSVV